MYYIGGGICCIRDSPPPFRLLSSFSRSSFCSLSLCLSLSLSHSLRPVSVFVNLATCPSGPVF